MTNSREGGDCLYQLYSGCEMWTTPCQYVGVVEHLHSKAGDFSWRLCEVIWSLVFRFAPLTCIKIVNVPSRLISHRMIVSAFCKVWLQSQFFCTQNIILDHIYFIYSFCSTVFLVSQISLIS